MLNIDVFYIAIIMTSQLSFILNISTKELMARPLRIECSGAYYHVINRMNAELMRNKNCVIR